MAVSRQTTFSRLAVGAILFAMIFCNPFSRLSLSLCLLNFLFVGAAVAGTDNVLKNGSFEGSVEDGGVAEDWQTFCHMLPDGVMEIYDEGKDGKVSLHLSNNTGPEPFHFVMWRQQLKGLNPAKEYVLEFWGRGEISGAGNRFGTCDDDAGNEGIAYAEVTSSESWEKYEVIFRPKEDGTKNIIFSSNDFIEDYFIDSVSVQEL